MTLSSLRPTRAGAAAAVLAVAVLPASVAVPASATSGRCSPGKGVTVVVDYGPLGGGVVIACDPDGGGKSAAEVITDAGFDLDYVSSQPGFVCRIDGQPGEGEEDCGDVPPADAYWGLFWSDADPATWAYSSEGIGSLDVPDGGSIGWRFQDGGTRENPSAAPTGKAATPTPQPSNEPGRTPSPNPGGGGSEVAQPTPTPTPSASVPPGTGAGEPPSEEPDPDAKQPGDEPGVEGGKGDKGNRGAQGGKGGKKGEDDKDRKGPGSKARPGQAARPSASPTVDAALSPASGEPLTDEGSSPVLTLVAGGAVLLLAGAAGVIAWRRRA